MQFPRHRVDGGAGDIHQGRTVYFNVLLSKELGEKGNPEKKKKREKTVLPGW